MDGGAWQGVTKCWTPRSDFTCTFTAEHLPLGDGEGHGSLACCSPWGCKELDTAERLDNDFLCDGPPVVGHGMWGLSLCRVFEWIPLKVKVLVSQSCPTLCDLMDCSPLGSSVHGMLQVRILEWVAVPFSRGSSRPRDQTRVSYGSCIAGGFFTVWGPVACNSFGRVVYIQSSTWKSTSPLWTLSQGYFLRVRLSNLRAWVFSKILFYWSRVDLQCYLNFWSVQQRDSVMHICMLFHGMKVFNRSPQAVFRGSLSKPSLCLREDHAPAADVGCTSRRGARPRRPQAPWKGRRSPGGLGVVLLLGLGFGIGGCLHFRRASRRCL